MMITNAPPWPNGAKCAVAFTFDLDADSILHLSHHASADTRIAQTSALRYGPEIALPRLLSIYREFDMRQTFFLPAWCMERYPASVEQILDDGHEIGHHHYLHEHANTMNAEMERYWFQRSKEVIISMTGQPPRGYRAATYRFSRNTLDILIDEGIRYDASLFGDDVPYVIANARGRTYEIPSHYGLDDWPHYQFSRGRLARASAIRKLISYMHNKGSVWFATLEEIADYLTELERTGQWHPRIDQLPYYSGPIPELGKVEAENAT